ncbi:hypothetical protein [Fusobacterium ulcerans]|uniref:Uncharacterized protein n=1 Tax=Fusobacterium ulcerans 12-1B TaxID=457404 RepID=H1PU13_9FUSO|nr:hypothetical protein [Fusobacterium ulcerans]EHO80833.1 hypothetical protein HMPREF0402_01906 [Fusobacterium ulcerans 12-1B]
MTEKNLNLIRELEEQIEDIKIKLKESNREDEKEKLADDYQKVYMELNEVYMENEKIANRLERENGL